jgi:hypothetical protein
MLIDGAVDIAGLEEVSDDHFSAGGPQGGRSVVRAADHGTNGKPSLEEQARHRSPHAPDLSG